MIFLGTEYQNQRDIKIDLALRSYILWSLSWRLAVLNKQDDSRIDSSQSGQGGEDVGLSEKGKPTLRVTVLPRRPHLYPSFWLVFRFPPHFTPSLRATRAISSFSASSTCAPASGVTRAGGSSARAIFGSTLASRVPLSGELAEPGVSRGWLAPRQEQ